MFIKKVSQDEIANLIDADLKAKGVNVGNEIEFKAELNHDCTILHRIWAEVEVLPAAKEADEVQADAN